MSKKAVMRNTRVLATPQSLITEFRRCSEKYAFLQIAVAWCSDPKCAPVFKLLKTFRDKMTATIGTAFNHTHPDAIEWFLCNDANVRIFRGEDILFHPKVYLFTTGEHYAAFVGSSNLTHGGFHGNCEVNTLIEGTLAGSDGEDIRELQETLDRWHSDDHSFEPTKEWLAGYRDQYRDAVARATRAEVRTPPIREKSEPLAGWLGTAAWSAYYRRVLEGLRQTGRPAGEYHRVLDAAAEELSVPWTIAYFDKAEKRRIMGGTSDYGWLGHVAAAGMLRKLLARGTTEDKQTIVNAMNRIAALKYPIRWNVLEAELNRLAQLKFTMKVWSRFLCLLRPDLFCTVASKSVRANLSEVLGVSHAAFVDPAGYVQLLKIFHSSPWFLSAKPKDSTEAAVWRRRVAFMDPIFY